jgi:C-terminal processing protease CtpA/Prc
MFCCCAESSGGETYTEALEQNNPENLLVQKAAITLDTKNAFEQVSIEKEAVEAESEVQVAAEEKKDTSDEKASSLKETSAENDAPSTGTGLQLEFIADGVTKNIDIKAAPLGLSFTTVKPLAVKKVIANGSGAKAGVQPGWVFNKINGESLDNLNYDESRAVLLKGVNKLPKDGDQIKTDDTLVIEFETSSASTPLQTVLFNHRPLEFTFMKDMPMVVKSVSPGGNADTLGVQVGWKVKSLGGVDIADMDYDDAIGILKQRTQALPETKVG